MATQLEPGRLPQDKKQLEELQAELAELKHHPAYQLVMGRVELLLSQRLRDLEAAPDLPSFKHSQGAVLVLRRVQQLHTELLEEVKRTLTDGEVP